MTSATSSTWMPRAAMSVATSVSGAAVGERGQVAVAGVLREVAVQLDGRHAGRDQLAGQRLGAALGTGEDEGAARRGGQVDQHRRTGRRRGRAARGGSSSATGARRRVDAVRDRVVQVALTSTSTPASRVAENSSRCAVARRLVQQPAHDRQEAEVGHVVGLVQHGDLDRVEVARGRTGRGRRAGRGRRRGCRRRRAGPGSAGSAPTPPKTVSVRSASACGERGDRGVDLGGQLAGRRQDQRARPAGAARVAGAGGEPGQHAAARTRTSCRSRCGPGRARRGRRASRAAWPPGSGTAR